MKFGLFGSAKLNKINNDIDSSLSYNEWMDFKVEAERNNHCGVYLGNDIFYHHAVKRLSCRESLYPFWQKWLVGAYRYVA